MMRITATANPFIHTCHPSHTIICHVIHPTSNRSLPIPMSITTALSNPINISNTLPSYHPPNSCHSHTGRIHRAPFPDIHPTIQPVSFPFPNVFLRFLRVFVSWSRLSRSESNSIFGYFGSFFSKVRAFQTLIHRFLPVSVFL